MWMALPSMAFRPTLAQVESERYPHSEVNYLALDDQPGLANRLGEGWV